MTALSNTAVKYPAYGYIDEASSFISQCLVGESPERDFVTKDDLGLTCLPQVLLTRVALTGVIPRDITLAAALLPKAV